MSSPAMPRLSVLLQLLLALGLGCSSDESPPAVTMPDDGFMPLELGPPARALMLSERDFDAQVTAGLLYPVSLRTTRNQAEREAAREASDDEVIAEAVAASPALARLVPAEPARDDTTVTPLEDGTYRHTILATDGSTRHVVTMGRAWMKAQLARSIRTFPTRDNQLAVYSVLYGSLDLEHRRALDLPSPDRVSADPGTYTVAKIRTLSDRVVSHAQELIDSYGVDPNRPPEAPATCADEEGHVDGSDDHGNDYDAIACKLHPDGIYLNHVWAGKYYNTCVKDQAGRGTCSVFADTSAIEYWVAVTHKRWVDLSEQAFYNRVKLVWERQDYGDGINADFALGKMHDEGWLLPFERQWPYNPTVDRVDWVGVCIQQKCGGQGDACIAACRDDPTYQRYSHSCDGYVDTCSDSTHQSQLSCMQLEDGYYCGYSVPEKNPGYEGYRVTSSAQFWDVNDPDTSLDRVRLALAAGKPVIIGHPVTPAFDAAGANAGWMTYVSGQGNRGGHGMHVLGFIDNAQLAELLPDAPPGAGGGYLIIKNSWSNCWGDGGYLYAPYDDVKEYAPDATVLDGVL